MDAGFLVDGDGNSEELESRERVFQFQQDLIALLSLSLSTSINYFHIAEFNSEYAWYWLQNVTVYCEPKIYNAVLGIVLVLVD